MLFIGWIEESVFAEGIFHHYLYEENHNILRATVRVTYVIILFLLGYKGLSYLQSSWVKQLWIAWYIIVILFSGIRMLPLLLFNYQLPMNIWNFLSSFYALGLTPFPYLIIWLLWIMIGQEIHLSNKT
jgi:hypothetical protein